MMAAMVLTSLSCSPVVQSPPGAEANFSGEEGVPRGFWVWQRLTTDFSALSSKLPKYWPGNRTLESLLTCVPAWLSDIELDASVLFPQFPPLGRSLRVRCEDD